MVAPPVEDFPRRNQSPDRDGDTRAKGVRNKQEHKKKVAANGDPAQVIPNQMSYVDTICLGCGEPGHFKQSCDKKAFCFICKATTHSVEECPMIKKRPPQIATYIGTAATGLGFFHIEIPGS
jgi:hypothetical protein